MKRIELSASFLTLGILASTLFVGTSTSGLAADSFTLVERATSDAVTDTGAKDDSVGDILTFANEIYDEANKKVVGSNTGYCFRTAVGKSWECAWTNTLADGQINVAGPFLDGKDSVLSVTGGTGKYASSRGEMMLHARNDKGTEYDFKFVLK